MSMSDKFGCRLPRFHGTLTSGGPELHSRSSCRSHGSREHQTL